MKQIPSWSQNDFLSHKNVDIFLIFFPTEAHVNPDLTGVRKDVCFQPYDLFE